MDNKVESDKNMRQLRAEIEASEKAHKDISNKYNDLDNKHKSIISDLKEKESQNEQLQRDKGSKIQEIQSLSQTLESLNDQIKSKVSQMESNLYYMYCMINDTHLSRFYRNYISVDTILVWGNQSAHGVQCWG